MTTINENLLADYAELKTQEKAVAEKLKELAPQIVEQMGKNEAEEIETSYGKFSISKRRSWTYPEDLMARETVLKADKKKAEQVGTATYEETPFLVYRAEGIKE